MKKHLILFAIAFLSFETNGYSATGESTESVSPRAKNKLGGYLSISEPSPTLVGLNVGYNVTDYLRASAGYGRLAVTSSLSIGSDGEITGTEASATTLGFGVRGFVPGWALSPTAGLHFAHVAYGGEGLEVGGFKESGSHLYLTAGFDWQMDSGLNFGGGYRYSFKSGIGGGLYLSAGWFVDWLG